ncbi:MAG: DUF1175 family protein [bacterium]|nr:DUF1175 family protein [bacterium]
MLQELMLKNYCWKILKLLYNYFPRALFYILFFFIISILACKSEFSSSVSNLPANGTSSGQVVLTKGFFSSRETITVPPHSDAIEIIKHEKDRHVERIYFRSTLVPGTVIFRCGNETPVKLTFYKTIPDLDRDGFPDEAELSSHADREAFRNWFVRIAESQYLKRNGTWNKKERDCSGLVRFAYKEALKKHNLQWQRKHGIVIDKNLPDVAKFTFPDVPVLGEKLFKISGGTAADGTSFGYFADSETLMKYNSFLVNRNIEDAKKGDILFFFNMGNAKYPYHSMIVAEITGNTIIIIYHTGEKDILKRVPVSYLDRSKIFRPISWNRHFLGVFRFHILH